MTTKMNIDRWMTHHPPTADQVKQYEEIREAGRRFMEVVAKNVADTEERKEAFKMIRAAVMWANAGIACNAA